MNDSTDDTEIEAAWVDDEGESIVEQALRYARAQMSVFPVKHSPGSSDDKTPMRGYGWAELASAQVNHVVEDFTAAIEQWGEENVSVAWAVGVDGYVAVDLDVAKDDWPEWTAEIVDSAAINLTRRGTHLIYRNPSQFEPGNTDTKFPTHGWGEVRGKGGYIVIAGPDRPGFDPNDKDLAQPFPRPEWLEPYGGGADAVSWAEVREFAALYNSGVNEVKLQGIRSACEKWDPANAGDASKGRHPYAVWLMTQAAEEAIEGHYPFNNAFQIISQWWKSVTPQQRHGRELKGITSWAVGRALSKAPSPASEGSSTGEGTEPEHPLDEGILQQSIRPLDWNEFWNTERSENDWFIEGFWPRGRAMVVHAKAKEGKSEFVLYCVLKLVQGVDPWTGEIIEPRTICYFDYEMTEDDLLDRLEDFGMSRESDLSRLKYYLLPPMAPLDTPTGAAEIMAIIERDRPDAIVIDTFGRAVEGEEDVADTVRSFYRLTGQRLKTSGVGYLRTDHTGKDSKKGQRGSSAKNDDVDVIWSMVRTSNGTTLTSRSRVSWVPEKLEVTRRYDEQDRLVYSTNGSISVEDALLVTGKATLLDQLGIPTEWGRDQVRDELRRLGHKPGKYTILSAAIKRRRQSGYSPAPRAVDNSDSDPSDIREQVRERVREEDIFE